MEDNTPVITQSKTVFNPERDTNKAKKASEKLIDIVKQNGWSVNVGGKSNHLMYEAWQTVGKYFNCSVGTGDAEPVEIDNVSGFKAKAYVIDNKTGVKVGEAEAYCMRDEANWKTKPTFQLASMAQTRAGAKALRQIFGFVVALAGYSPTPAEEMIQEAKLINDYPSSPYAELGSTTSSVKSEILATDKQWTFIKQLWKNGEQDEAELNNYIEELVGIESAKDLSLAQASKVIGSLQK